MPSTEQSTGVNAPIAGVWSRFSDVHNMLWAPTSNDAEVFCRGICAALPGDLESVFTP